MHTRQFFAKFIVNLTNAMKKAEPLHLSLLGETYKRSALRGPFLLWGHAADRSAHHIHIHLNGTVDHALGVGLIEQIH